MGESYVVLGMATTERAPSWGGVDDVKPLRVLLLLRCGYKVSVCSGVPDGDDGVDSKMLMAGLSDARVGEKERLEWMEVVRVYWGEVYCADCCCCCCCGCG